jgi:DNA-directed RNA polymerase specialized sigma24 family protein
MAELPDEVVREALERSAWDKRRAAQSYRSAVETAHEQGWTHTEIARVVGVSEAAIRLYLKRGKRNKSKRR